MSERIYPGSLHNHTEYSNLRIRDCIIKVDQAMSYAEELGHELIAFTDHDFVGTWIKIEKEAQKHPNLKVIYGNEIYLCRNGLNPSTWVKGQDKYYHFVLLAKDAIGAKQIRQISTRAWARSYMSRGMRRVPTYYQDLFDIVGEDPGHVIAQSACLGGSLPTQLLKWRDNQSIELYEKIRYWCRQMNELFGDGNFYLELQPSESADQAYVNRQLIKLSNDLKIPYIITTDSHYLKKSDAALHAAYLNAQDGDREVSSFYATTYMMDTAELESHMDLTETELEIAYSNIREIGKKCENFTNLRPLRIPRLLWREPPVQSFDTELWYSRIPTLKTFMESDYEGDRTLGLHIVGRLLEDEALNTREMWDALEDNLNKTWESSVVNKTHWSAYFLNLQKNIDVCWEANTIVGPGRGSGVGFVLLYILDIIQINCLREDVQTFSFRFLNPSRVSVLDVDTDVEGGRRADILNAFRKTYGADHVANVATFRTEKPKAAILTACRGLEYEVEVGQYLSSLVPVERGESWTLEECMYGNEDKGRAPVKQFVLEMTENYSDVWELASKISGLVCGYGIHAGGVIFVDEPFEESTALMRAPDDTTITQFDLHDDEAASLIKIDLLSVEAMDKIHVCLDLLCDAGYLERKPTLRETYENALNVYELEREDPKMWEMIWEHKINSLFQMEKDSGIKGIALTKPKSVEDLAHLNSIIRLMAQEKGGEMPIDKYTRFKNNISLWYQEMEDYGLTQAEIEVLKPVLSGSYGVCESQEGFMQLLQIPECGGFDLNFADRVRKSVSKKNAKEYEALTKEYFEECAKKQLSKKLCSYVWNVLVATSRGYSFKNIETLYSNI